MSDSFVFDVMRFMAEHELMDGDIFWDEGLNFYILCNDFFYWGTADAEDLTSETFDELKQAFEDTMKDGYNLDGCDLYCARRRGLRPQGACYKHIQEEHWPLFNACGPKRETGMGNPHEQQ